MLSILLLMSLMILQIVDTKCTTIAVFCSGDNKVSQTYKNMAHNLGAQLGKHRFGLVTGGSNTGLMKEVVDGYVATSTSLDNLFGVLPEALKMYNVHHPRIPETQLTWVETMYLRLEKFHALCDTIIILPGGFGTLHELMDFLVHNQFDISKKRVILINLNGFWNNLIAQFNVMVAEQLLALKHFEILSIVPDENKCIERLFNETIEINNQSLASCYWESNTPPQ